MDNLPVISMEDRYDDGNLYLFIALQDCNIKCSHCYVYEQVTGPAKQKSIDEIKRLANSDIYDGIIISGGEPLLYCERLIKLLEEIDTHVTVYTNGILLNALVRTIRDGELVDELLISLKHPDDIEGFDDNYYKTINNLMAFERGYEDKVDVEFVIVDTENVTDEYITFLENCFESSVIIRKCERA